MSKELSKVLKDWKAYALSTNLEDRNGDLCQAIKEITQAAANKAAEEGGLPDEGFLYGYFRKNGKQFDMLKKRPNDHTLSSGWVPLYTTKEAADRASRQVANKAEVEPSDSYKAGYADGMDEGAKLAFWGDKPSEKFPEGWPSEIWLNAGDDELGPFSEYDELSWYSAPQGESDVRYIREDLLDTPPATTGASTILTEAQVFFNGAWKPATAEAFYSMTEDKRRVVDVAREVAAQAGQVAVPGWISTDDRLPENGKDVIILYWPYNNHENERVAGTAHHVEGTFYDEDGNDMHPPSHWMPFVIPEAAPSPAKESK